jgi:hypothetical protein
LILERFTQKGVRWRVASYPLGGTASAMSRPTRALPRSASIRFSVEPRDVPPEKAARRLHLTLSQFELLQDNLFARGFPPPDPDTGMYDLRAIDAWMDRRNTITRGDGLTGASTPRNAEEVFGDRARRLLNG